MNKALQILVLLCSPVWLVAQEGIERAMTQIEGNNTTLAALRQRTEADRRAGRIGILPSDPEVGLGFLRGSPSAMGRRTDLELRQTFDFPLVYLQRDRLVRLRDGQLDLGYQRQRRALLLEARLVCLDLVHANALVQERRRRFAQATRLAAAIEAKFEKGDTNVLERNKARLHLLATEKALEESEVERNLLRAELVRMNGGLAIELTDDHFPPPGVPADFASWCRQAEVSSPSLRWLRYESERIAQQVRADRTANLPKLSIGFSSESVQGERFSGVTVGFTVPLWERKHVVAAGKATAAAVRLEEADGRLQFLHRSKALYERVVALNASAADFRTRLAALDHTPLLQKALDHGEIALADYLLEQSIFADSVERLLRMERDLGKALAELNQFQ